MSRWIAFLLVSSPALVASPVSSLTVGHLSGQAGTDEEQAGNIVSPLVTSADSTLGIQVVNSDILDAGFFSQIDIFVFANSAGSFTYTLGPAARSAVVDFVTSGGTAYLGLDQLGDASELASAFGFTLTGRQTVCTTELVTISGSSNPISTGSPQVSSA